MMLMIILLSCSLLTMQYDAQTVQTKQTYGPMLSFTMPAAIHLDIGRSNAPKLREGKWTRTPITKKYLSTSVTDEEFDRQIKDIEDYDEYVCDMRFIQATYEVLHDKATDEDYIDIRRHPNFIRMKKGVRWLRRKFGAKIAAPVSFTDRSDSCTY